MTKEQLQIITAAKKSLFKKSFYHFFLEFWNEVSSEPLVDNWHIKVLCDELQLISERLKERKPKLYDLVINVPPSSSKSTIASILWPVWNWIIDPTLKILSASYGQSLSFKHTTKSRAVINSPKFKRYFPELALKKDMNTKHLYENTSTGERVASSVGSGIIGTHYHAIIVDDPLQANPSDNEVETANDWIFQGLSTRKVDNELTPIILIMQRLREDDCSSMLILKGFNTKHICLTAELSSQTSTDYIKYYQNGLFDPKRLSTSVLAQKRIELGGKGFSCQYMQNPLPDDGGILKKNWFKIVKKSTLYASSTGDKSEMSYDTNIAEMLKNIQWSMVVDSAYTADKENDASAIMIAGSWKNNLYIKKSYQYWKEYPQLIQIIQQHAVEFNCRRIYIEPKASGLSVIQTLRQTTRLNIVDLDSPKDSKIIRVNAIAPIVEAQRVFLLEDSWNDGFITEVCGFPLSKNDDQIDTLVYSINRLLQSNNKLIYKST